MVGSLVTMEQSLRSGTKRSTRKMLVSSSLLLVSMPAVNSIDVVLLDYFVRAIVVTVTSMIGDCIGTVVSGCRWWIGRSLWWCCWTTWQWHLIDKKDDVWLVVRVVDTSSLSWYTVRKFIFHATRVSWHSAAHLSLPLLQQPLGHSLLQF